MNEAPVLIDIALIVSNPFQVRQAEDPAAVTELAANIEKNRLLQPPLKGLFPAGAELVVPETEKEK